jgi:geranylgeranyl pyrophosphate synthase
MPHAGADAATSRTLSRVDGILGAHDAPRRGELARILHANRPHGPRTDALALLAESYSTCQIADPTTDTVRALLTALPADLLAEPDVVVRAVARALKGLPLAYATDGREETLVALFLRHAVGPGTPGRGTWTPRPAGRRFTRLTRPPLELFVPRDRLEAVMAGRIVAAPEPARALGHAMLRSGGKRLRARLLLRLAGETSAEAWAHAAVVEWLHQVSLVLDDIIDGAHKRRGQACLHRRFGVASVIAGAIDLLRVVVADLPADVRTEVAVAAFDLARGELLESILPPDDEASYDAMITAKTGSLFRLAARLGAKTGGRDVASAGAVGDALGAAFQVVDDCLDLGASTADTGKDALQDVARDRWTLPRHVLRERLPVGVVEPDPPDAQWTRHWLHALDVDAACRATARARVTHALAAADLDVPLDDLVAVVLERTR